MSYMAVWPFDALKVATKEEQTVWCQSLTCLSIIVILFTSVGQLVVDGLGGVHYSL